MPRTSFNLKAEPSPKVGTGCVVVTIPYKIDKFVLQRLKTGEVCGFHGKLVDNAIVAYACFKRVQNELMGNATNVSSHKVANVTCGCSPDDFIISAICDKTVSSMRKTAGTIIKNLKFSVLTQDYKGICKTLGIKPDTDAFVAAVKDATDAAKKSIDVGFAGKFKVKKEQIDSAYDTLENKIPEFTDKGKGSARNIEVSSDMGGSCKDHWIELKAGSHMDAVILHGFLEGYVNNAFVCGSHVHVPIQYETITNRVLDDSGKRDRYANKLYRLGDEIGGIVTFQGSTQASLITRSMNSKKKYSMSDIKRAIKA